MKYGFIAVIVAILILASASFAYSGFSGFNRYYYTNNYTPTVYYNSPGYTYDSYGYPGYYTSYYYPTYTYPAYYSPTYYVPTYYAPTYYAPAYGSSISYYGSNWGISVSSGYGVCAIYGYC